MGWGAGEVKVRWEWDVSDLSKMFTFIKMVITGVENRSPDMIPVAFDRKFDEKKNEMHPGICRPHILQIIKYWEFGR